MEKQTKEKVKDRDSAIILRAPRVRFSDCCNAEIQNNRCPSCGRYIEAQEGRRELKIKGLDGRTTAKAHHYIVTMIDAEPKKEDPMPKYFKALKDRGMRIDSWSDSSQ